MSNNEEAPTLKPETVADIMAGTCAVGMLDCSLVEFLRGLKFFMDEESRGFRCDTHLLNILRRAACVAWELERAGRSDLPRTDVEGAAREIVAMIEHERETYPEWHPQARKKYVTAAARIIQSHCSPAPATTELGNESQPVGALIPPEFDAALSFDALRPQFDEDEISDHGLGLLVARVRKIARRYMAHVKLPDDEESAGELIERAEALSILNLVKLTIEDGHDRTEMRKTAEAAIEGIRALPSVQPAAVACGCRAVVEKMRDGFQQRSGHAKTQEMGAWNTAKSDAANEILAALPAPSRGRSNAASSEGCERRVTILQTRQCVT